jgi:hypothetical protein
MPMLYGEGARAFARLQEEIMNYKQPWDDRREAETILAPVPALFQALPWPRAQQVKWLSSAFPLNDPERVSTHITSESRRKP